MLLRSPGLCIRSGLKRGEGRAAGWRSRCILRLPDAGHFLDTHSATASLQVEAVQQNGLAQPREATCAKVAVQRAGRQPFAVDGLKIGKAGGPEALNDFSLRAAGAAALDLVVHRDSGEHGGKLRSDGFRLPQPGLPNRARLLLRDLPRVVPARIVPLELGHAMQSSTTTFRTARSGLCLSARLRGRRGGRGSKCPPGRG